MDELTEALQTYLISKSADILNIEKQEILWVDDIDEFGFSSMEVNQLCAELNEECNIAVHPALFLEVTSLEAFSQHLLAQYYPQMEEHLL